MKRITQVLTDISVFLVAWLCLPIVVQAHATSIQTIPAENTSLDAAPSAVVITFNEAVVPELSSVTLLAQTGKEVTVDVVFSNDDEVATAALPALDNAAYLASWNVVSAVDGHNTTGTFSFGVGVDALSTAERVTFLDGIYWLSATARTLRIIGTALLIGVFSFGVFVDDAGLLGRRLAWLAVGLLIAGLLLTFVNQVRQSGLETVTTWLGTTFGRLWMLQIIGLGLLIPAVNALENNNRNIIIVGLLGTLGVAVFNAMSSHSAALSAESVRGTLIDLAHVGAAGVWAGGLLLLVAKWRVNREAWRAESFVRFSTLAAMAMAVLFLSGGWLSAKHVGSWNGLVGTTYGLLLLLKMALLLPVLGIAAYNLFVVGRKLKTIDVESQNFTSEQQVVSLPKRLLAIEAILAAAILITAGFVSDAQRAASAPLLTAEAGLTTLQNTEVGLDVTVAIEPALVGNNQFNLIITDENGSPVTDARDVTLRFTYLDQSLGDNYGTAQHRGSGVYTIDGSFISLSGQWQLEVKVVQDGVYDTFVPYRVEAGIGGDIRSLDANVGVLERLGKFLTLTDKAGTGVLMIVFALGWVVVTTRATDRLWQTVPLLVACAAIVWYGSTQLIDFFENEYTPGKFATNPILPDSASIAQGQTAFEMYCVQCHGIDGAGDGPIARNLTIAPANFADGHTEIHTDGDLFYWIANGKSDGQMPPWGATLDEETMWHLVNYVRRLAITGEAISEQ